MEYETPKGISFYRAIKEVKELLQFHDKADFTLDFNGVEVSVSFDSNPSDLATIYDLKCELRRLK